MPELTKSAYRLLFEIYSEYLRRIDHGHSPESSRYFGSDSQLSDLVHAVEDIIPLAWELHRHGFLCLMPGDDGFSESFLESKAIAFMESLPVRGVSSLVDLAAKFMK